MTPKIDFDFGKGSCTNHKCHGVLCASDGRAALWACLASPGHLLFVALDDGRDVAQAAGMIHRHVDKPSELYVDEVGVSPAWQRRGIASLLMDALFAAGREAGCAEAWLGTEPDNLPARALYDGRKEPAEPVESFVHVSL